MTRVIQTMSWGESPIAACTSARTAAHPSTIVMVGRNHQAQRRKFPGSLLPVAASQWQRAGEPEFTDPVPASGTYCLFMTDSTARQLGYRLLVGFELELLAATNSQKSDGPYQVAEHQLLGGP